VKLCLTLINANVRNNLTLRVLHKSVSNKIPTSIPDCYLSIFQIQHTDKRISVTLLQGWCWRREFLLVLNDNWPDCDVLLLYSPQTLHSIGKSQYLLLHCRMVKQRQTHYTARSFRTAYIWVSKSICFCINYTTQLA